MCSQLIPSSATYLEWQDANIDTTPEQTTYCVLKIQPTDFDGTITLSGDTQTSFERLDFVLTDSQVVGSYLENTYRIDVLDHGSNFGCDITATSGNQTATFAYFCTID